MPAKPQYEIIVYGATSFVGQILSRYLQENYGKDGDLKWAIAGRSASKLEAVKRDIAAPDLPMIVADASDRAALDGMVKQTKVIISTVGPYALYGDDVVAACVANGNDYCDLTGESQWMRKMIDAHQAEAEKTGARIVHNCGFDSIPSDMGLMYTQQQAKKTLGETCSKVSLRVKAMKGAASGGTVASLLNVVKEASKDAGLRKELQNPYSVAPEGMRSGPRQPDTNMTGYDKVANSWIAPFVMAAINTRVIQRSHALLGRPWGENFMYDEATLMGDGVKGRAAALGMTAGLGGFVAAAAVTPARTMLEKYVLPKPGEGPSPEAQEKGFFDLRLYGTTDSGKTIVTKVTGDKDPGYGSTAKMLGESGLCLARDVTRRSVKGGFWTPSTALGEKLLKRLEANAGLTFTTLS